MTLTADNAAPAASEQPKCPEWCTDHHPHAEIHRTACAESDFSQPRHASWIAVKGIDYCRGHAPEVSIGGWRQVIGTGKFINPRVDLSPVPARQIADLIEILADATPEQHREVAAAIRKAADAITEAGQ
jgi:hypothetical protein